MKSYTICPVCRKKGWYISSSDYDLEHHLHTCRYCKTEETILKCYPSNQGLVCGLDMNQNFEREIAKAEPVYGNTVHFEIADLVSRGVATIKEIESWAIAGARFAWGWS